MQKNCFEASGLDKAVPSGKVERIGIAGSGPAVGTTHFTILTASYLTGVRKKKTAVLEWNDRGSFQLLKQVRKKKTVTNRTDQSFNILGILFYRDADDRTLLDCSTWQAETIVIDFGCYRKEIQGELLKCDRRFLVCSVSDWQLPQTAVLFDRAGDFRHMGWEYFASFGGEEALRMAEKYLGVRIHRIPVSQDAFVITGELMIFFGRFLN